TPAATLVPPMSTPMVSAWIKPTKSSYGRGQDIGAGVTSALTGQVGDSDDAGPPAEAGRPDLQHRAVSAPGELAFEGPAGGRDQEVTGGGDNTPDGDHGRVEDRGQ